MLVRGLAASVFFVSVGASAQQLADTIYSGGAILTVNDARPVAEAVAVRDGRILAVGSMTEVSPHIGEDTARFDLDGRAMLPGFVDSHGHVSLGGLTALTANLLAPPDGRVRDFDSLQAELRRWVEANADSVATSGMIIGFGYDNAQFAEQQHPTREMLDAVSTEYPVLIVHQSGHLGVANSRALELAGYDATTDDPAGGVIRRGPGGEPSGVLEEYAFFKAFMPLIGALGEEGMQAFAAAGAEQWASFGYTTGQDGRSSPGMVNALKTVDAAGNMPIDVVAYPDVLEAPELIASGTSLDYDGRVRIGGCKLTIDGSPQAFTALRDRPYYDPVGNYPPGYKGYPAVDMQQTQDAVDFCYEQGVQMLTHANGEGASDMLIAALAAAQAKYPARSLRPVLIHGQFLREDQVDRLAELGVFPSLFPMHTFYWGDWHRDHTVGPVNADNISPTGWVRQRGMMFGTHHDAPVALPDSMRVLSATVTRRTRSGDILGPDQRVDVMTALNYDHLARLAALRGGPQGHHRSRQAGGLRDPVRRPHRRRSGNPGGSRCARHHQGRQNHLRSRRKPAPNRFTLPRHRRRARHAPRAVRSIEVRHDGAACRRSGPLRAASGSPDFRHHAQSVTTPDPGDVLVVKPGVGRAKGKRQDRRGLKPFRKTPGR